MNCIWKAISTFCLYPSYQLLTDLTTLIFRRITEDNFFRTDESLSLIWLMQFLAQKMKDWHITIILNQSNTLLTLAIKTVMTYRFQKLGDTSKVFILSSITKICRERYLVFLSLQLFMFFYKETNIVSNVTSKKIKIHVWCNLLTKALSQNPPPPTDFLPRLQWYWTLASYHYYYILYNKTRNTLSSP